VFKPRQKLGKYRIVRRLAKGGFAEVFEALDTIEGIHVALKIPLPRALGPGGLEDFRREVRLTAKLDHPNILPIKNADFIDKRFVVVYALGERSLADRMLYRLSARTVFSFAEQMLEATAHAHRRHVIHCDIKPENFILFPGGRVRLTDFGIARIGFRTIEASGSGTIGYISPEQAHGRPSKSSDVFSLGLILYQMLTNELPRWPFEWPPPGSAVLRRKFPAEGIDMIRRAIQVDTRRRFPDAPQMQRAFLKMKEALVASPRRRRRWLG
jgi:serine/threonine-protein kinase